jgi:hypothetical protein
VRVDLREVAIKALSLTRSNRLMVAYFPIFFFKKNLAYFPRYMRRPPLADPGDPY